MRGSIHAIVVLIRNDGVTSSTEYVIILYIVPPFEVGFSEGGGKWFSVSISTAIT